MKIKKYAAIDIGSNAIRMLVSNVINHKKKQIILKNALVRVPIRLGEDFFNVVGNEKTFLYVDVGGGSTEFSVLKNGKRIHSKSFKIGTVRLLNDGVTEELWLLAENWVKEKTKEYQKIYLLGTGGNINKLHKMANIKDDRPITYLTLSAMYSKLSKMTYEERIIKLGLNPDRSDVILPAAQLFLKTLNWSGAKVIYVPKVGLSDGMIRELCKKKKMNS
jgi:exopolyphosphatase/guanosine-5'-triphosphate,3'-diphosphate pyrophosphatase